APTAPRTRPWPDRRPRRVGASAAEIRADAAHLPRDCAVTGRGILPPRRGSAPRPRTRGGWAGNSPPWREIAPCTWPNAAHRGPFPRHGGHLLALPSRPRATSAGRP